VYEATHATVHSSWRCLCRAFITTIIIIIIIISFRHRPVSGPRKNAARVHSSFVQAGHGNSADNHCNQTRHAQPCMNALDAFASLWQLGASWLKFETLLRRNCAHASKHARTHL
jgi:hypothetical protein